MTRERIESMRDAQHTKSHYHRHGRHRSNVTANVEDQADHSVSGVGMNGFEFAPHDMRTALGKLEQCRAELIELRRRAGDLATPVEDGTSLVAHHMRRAYRHRSDEASGVQAVLDHYLAELDAVHGAITMTMASYVGVDEEAGRLVSLSTDEGE